MDKLKRELRLSDIYRLNSHLTGNTMCPLYITVGQSPSRKWHMFILQFTRNINILLLKCRVLCAKASGDYSNHYAFYGLWTIFFQNASRNRSYRVLAMVYNTQNHWFYGLCPSSGILINYKTQRFRNWICLRLQAKGGRHLLCWIP
jgi:hypothetical protein